MADSTWETKAAGALQRYRVMAWVTGVMLLLVFIEWFVKAGLDAGPDVVRWIDWIPKVHGFIYIVYLVTVMDVWSTMRWRLGRLVAMVLGGVVPFLSFIVERRVHAEGLAQLAIGRPAPRTTVAR